MHQGAHQGGTRDIKLSTALWKRAERAEALRAPAGPLPPSSGSCELAPMDLRYH